MSDESFVPLVRPPEELPLGAPRVFRVRGDQVRLDTGVQVDPGTHVYVGRLGDVDCWAVDVDGDEDPDIVTTSLMALHGEVSETEWAIAGRAVQLVHWRRTHRFCGRCAEPTAEAPGERAMRCPRCGLLAFPRLSPAIITLVTRDDGAALLARNAAWPNRMFSCLAGFVEPGETLEAAVVREVREEVGIEVGDVRYHSSQPWPFPHSLMIGFRAHHVGGEVVADGVEIAEADWFHPEDLPPVPPPVSIARRLIDAWAAGT